MSHGAVRLAGILSFTILSLAAQGESGSKDETGVIRAVDRGVLVGPQGNPFNMPSDAAVGRDGALYVLDGVNHRVVVYDTEGQLRFQFGSRGPGAGQFAYPLGIAAGPDGDIYVADSGNHRFQVFTAEGRLVEAVALPVASDTRPDPTDVAVDAVRKRLYIADNDNHHILVYDLANRRFEPVWGGPGQGQRQFRFPFLVSLSEQGYLFVVESINTRVQVLNPDGKFVAFIGGWGIDPGQLFRPKGVALWRDRAFVTDSYLGNVQVFDLSGRFLGALADPAGTKMDFASPTGIAVDTSRNYLYVVELKAHRVRRLDLGPESEKPQTDHVPQKTGSVGSTGPVGPFTKANPQTPSASGKDILPNSTRECGICHVRWVQAFDRGQPLEGAMADVMERKAGSGDMCLSCHDGSVTDSRFKVWSTRHHTTDAVPSPAVHIPTDRFPLDAQGRMTCATCHTAHAVPGDSDLRTVIFLRQPNVDSSLCLTCHPGHAQKSDFQHPLGPKQSPIPKVILEAGGKTAADGHTILCQTCHEPHGARNAWMLVLPPSELCVACHTEKAPEVSPPAGAPAHRIGHTYAGFQPPATLLKEKATFGPGGELSCLSCHRLHDASGAKPLLIRKNQDSSLCIECHEKQKAVLGSPHDLRVSSPQTANAHSERASASGPCGACHRVHGWARDVPETNRPHSSGCMECHGPGGPGSRNRPYAEAHPVGIAVPEGKSITLPLDQATKAIGCLTCHDPHIPRPAEESIGPGSPIEPAKPQLDTGRTPRSFLRQANSQLCIACHDKMGDSLQGPHDPARFTPALQETLGVTPSAGSCSVCHAAHNARGPHLWARTPANSANGPLSDLCGACHNGDSVKGPQGTHHPLTPAASHRLEDGRTGPAGPASEVSCISCHEPHGGAQSAAQLRRPSDSPCLTCHEDKQQIKGSVHDPGASAWGKNLGLVSQDLCLDCHPIHGPKEQGGIWRSLGGERTAENLCEACHRPGGPGPPVKTPHVGKPEAGSGKQILCTTCHDIHENGQHPKLLRASRQDSTQCITCHSGFGRILETPHDLRKSAPAALNVQGEPAAESGPCGVCHLVHPASAGEGTWARPVPPGGNSGKGLCTCCHSQGQCAQTHVPQYTDHPEVAILNRLSPGHPDYMPTFDDSGRPSPTGAISCPTCHQMHAPRAAAAGGGPSPSRPMLLRTTHQTLCTDCHGIQTPWRFLYYHEANRNPYRERATDAPAVDARNEGDSPPGS